MERFSPTWAAPTGPSSTVRRLKLPVLVNDGDTIGVGPYLLSYRDGCLLPKTRENKLQLEARICGVLADMSLLSRADTTALTCYCEAWSRYRRALDHVQRFGAVILSPNKKYPMVSPYESVMRKAHTDVMTFLTEFGLLVPGCGLMPVSRCPKGSGQGWWGNA